MDQYPYPPADAVEDQGSHLRDATLEGTRWIVYGRVAAEITAFATLVILAHLIRPQAYGRVAIALILQTLAISLTNEGFGNPLVQRKVIRTRHLECATLMSIAFGFALGALFFLICPLITTPLYGWRTTQLVRIACLLFPVYSLIIVPEAILQRQLDLRRITIAETAGLLASSMVSIPLAALGLSGRAIIIGTIAGAVVTATILLVWMGMPWPKWHRREASEVAGYGIPASFAGLVYLGVRNVDNVLVGARLGASQLGLYSRAFSLGVLNQLKIGLILMRVAFPAYSQSKDGAAMRDMRDRMTRLNATISIPLLVLLAVTAPKLVPFVFGRHWTAAAGPTQILAFAGIASALTHCAFPFLFAAGHPRAVLKLNSATFVVFVVSILIALPRGLEAVCVAVVVTNALTMIGAYASMARLTDVPLRRIWDDNTAAVAGSGALAVVAVPIMASLSGTNLPPLVVLLAVGAAGTGACIMTLTIFFRGALNDLMLIARRVLSRRRPAKLAPEVGPITALPMWTPTRRRNLGMSAAIPAGGTDSQPGLDLALAKE